MVSVGFGAGLPPGLYPFFSLASFAGPISCHFFWSVIIATACDFLEFINALYSDCTFDQFVFADGLLPGLGAGLGAFFLFTDTNL
ncbi:hypothetical protein PBCV1_a146L [Paramecium bursaria Chlorella virus 1]|uniref:Uncharacterized protein n=1 Tax=Paramecium bursaria Chlorella virus 1 TaxID=10506 RepID=Q84466_PBCV1|nr:hypothetical protein PBCV1_a146L [Paramecium bursaria Chlorella virus 1]AAC96514.1 hypothetical protein [Paramecium bursaria Chlorella virus 1]